jgi:hypothetical protein
MIIGRNDQTTCTGVGWCLQYPDQLHLSRNAEIGSEHAQFGGDGW